MTRWRARIEELPPIDASREGEPAVATGTVVAIGEPLAAPLSGLTCVAYHTSARAWMAFPLVPPEVAVVHPFLVDGGTAGRWRIDTTTAVLAVPEVPRAQHRTAALRQFDATYRFHPNAMTRVKYIERIVAVGARVRVAGIVALDTEPASDIADDFRSTSLALRLIAGDAQPVVVIDA